VSISLKRVHLISLQDGMFFGEKLRKTTTSRLKPIDLIFFAEKQKVVDFGQARFKDTSEKILFYLALERFLALKNPIRL
jgi:hypothetical protein